MKKKTGGEVPFTLKPESVSNINEVLAFQQREDFLCRTLMQAKHWLKQVSGAAMYFGEDPITWQQKAKKKGLEYFSKDISWLM